MCNQASSEKRHHIFDNDIDNHDPIDNDRGNNDDAIDLCATGTVDNNDNDNDDNCDCDNDDGDDDHSYSNIDNDVTNFGERWRRQCYAAVDYHFGTDWSRGADK